MRKKKRKKTSRNKYIPCDFPAIVDKENDTQMIEYARYNDNFSCCEVLISSKRLMQEWSPQTRMT